MKQIKLTKGEIALVDNSDFEFLSAKKWRVDKKGYAMHTIPKTNGRIIKMHRLILNAPLGMDVDHIDGNKLNNQRSNLRLANRTQNNANVVKRIGNFSSKYKGVCWNKNNNNWGVYIKFQQKTIYLGSFKSEIKAAKAYDQKAVELFGQFAKLNIKKNGK